MSTLIGFVLVPALVAFGGLPLVLFLWGRRLPAEHETSRSVRVAAKREDVFALLMDVRAIPRWRKRVGRIDVIATEPRLRFREYGAQGTLEVEIDEALPPSKLVLRAAPARRMAFEGTWTYALDDDDGNTRITLTEHGVVRSPIARVFAIYVLGHATHVERTLSALAARFSR